MPSQNWGKHKSWPPKAEHKIVEEEKLKDKLEKMDMKGLRDYAKKHKLSAKDTDKDELINEIIKEVS